MTALKSAFTLLKIPSFSKFSTTAYSFKSAISLETLYPKSHLNLITPSKPSTSQFPDFSGYIPLEKLQISYSRSSGPGGQNVNKVNTKVDVRFHLESASWLSDDVKSKILQKFFIKITKDGYLVFRSDLTRSQHLNLADCLEKLRNCVRTALEEAPAPSEESIERARKRRERANQERLAQKRLSGLKRSEKQLDHVEF